MRRVVPIVAAMAGLAIVGDDARGSSHREAPFITENPKVDGTDLYMFRSYEPGRGDFVTLLANYYPVQDPAGGPNFFALDDDAIYEIHVDNDGDAVEDMTFRFKFKNEYRGLALEVGEGSQRKRVAVPVINIGPFSAGDTANLNRLETYTLDVIRGDRRTGDRAAIRKVGGGRTFEKPVDNIGTKSIPDYAAYAGAHVFSINIPGCNESGDTRGRVFVGQRREGFAVAVGELFDLVNLNPLGDPEQGLDDLDKVNVTTLALEVPIHCLTMGDQPVIGGWTTSSVRQARVLNPNATLDNPTREGGAWTQISRLGNPLVNEVVIGLEDKNRFNVSEPSKDGQFIDYVTHPTLPELVEILFGSAGVVAPNLFPRADLIAVFLTGVAGVNMTDTPSEMQRLNTAIPPTPMDGQNNLGAALCFVEGTLDLENPGCDPAGFPNGRRPGDDTVDIALRVAMGYLLPQDVAPSGQLPFTDGASVSSKEFFGHFPYLGTPLPGAGR